MKSLTKNNDGFISIIAIGVFALLMIFGISLQMTVIDTLQNLKNGVNYDSARDTADSTIEYLQWKMKNYSAGLNDTAKCTFVAGKIDTTGSTGSLVNQSVCGELSTLIGTKNAGVTITVKGRSCSAEEFAANKCSTNDKLTSGKCGADACYVTPTPGTGDAGANCALYKPNSVANSNNVDSTLPAVGIALDQVDYSCNWNKLIFGSGQTDRVAIPLYYDSSVLSDQPNQLEKIVNPYFGATPTAKKFYVRLRTPCKPCATGTSATADQRACNGTALHNAQDPTVCEDTDRYVLDTGKNNDGDDIVVQWLINGECVNETTGKNESCGMTPIADKKANITTYSSLYESRIYANNEIEKYNLSSNDYIVINNSTLAFDTNAYPKQTTIIDPSDNPLKSNSNKLSQMTKPVFTLFLNKPLLTPDKSNIPYLEYQVLTDYPVGNSKSSLDVIVNVEGNNFRKTLTQEVQKALIDFAIHN